MISCFAPAKINLYLHVTGRRRDGLHNIDSLVVFADFGDSIFVQRDKDLVLEITGPFANHLSANEDNLVLKAANLLAQYSNVKPQAKIYLAKNLPIASGIGGGSADAAAALVSLSQLWELGLPKKSLLKIAAELGADIPACISREPVLISGYGDKLSPVSPFPSGWLLLVNSGVPVSTKLVYKRHNGKFTKPAVIDYIPSDLPSFAVLLEKLSNDLTAAALSIAPTIGKTIEIIAATEGNLLSRLSGSGATCFGLYEHKKEAERAMQTVLKLEPKWWVQSTPFFFPKTVTSKSN